MMYNNGTYTTRLRTLTELIFIITTTVILFACGGGGGGGGGGGSDSAPSVVNQSFLVIKGSSLTQNAPGVLTSSSDPSALTAILVSDPIHGLLTLNPDGSFSYAHNGSSSSSDSFTFKATDGSNDSNIATVTILINASPVINNACLSTDNLPGNLNNFVTDDDTLLTFIALSQPSQGTLDLQPDGTFNYTLNNGNENFKGIDSFSFQVDDGNGGKASGTASIVVGKTRIMPLGDSITVGNTQGPICQNPTTIPSNEFIGYRAKLYNDLIDSGSFIDFIGSQSNGLGANPAIIDPHHQGNGGDTTSDIVSGITGWLGNNPPDIVLLHIGTNDVNDSNFNAAVSRANIEAILNAIDTWEGTNNSVTVLLSTIIDRSTQPFCAPSPVYNNANVNDLNGEISNLVVSRTNDNLILVDQHGAIVPATHISSDGVHPNTQGYEKMADEWFSILTNSTNGIEILSCPSV